MRKLSISLLKVKCLNISFDKAYFCRCYYCCRNVQADGLQTAYSDAENPEIRVAGVHQLLSLGFIPVEDVGATFDLLMDDLPDRLVDFADSRKPT